MSDVKGAEPKVEAKPTEPAAARPAEAIPAPAKPAEAKAPEAKPAVPPAAAPAAAPAAPAAAAPAKPAAPAPPAPGTVGVRAPAPKPPEPAVNITISPKTAMAVLAALVITILFLGGMTVFLLMRINDRNGLANVEIQLPGRDGVPVPGAVKAAAPEAPAKVEIGSNFK